MVLDNTLKQDQKFHSNDLIMNIELLESSIYTTPIILLGSLIRHFESHFLK